MLESDAIIADMQKSIETMTQERDEWRRIARTMAHFATTEPYVYYGRSIDYAIKHASDNR